MAKNNQSKVNVQETAAPEGMTVFNKDFAEIVDIINGDRPAAEKWSLIARTAELHSDGWSAIKDLTILSDAEIIRRMKNIASKKVQAKKLGDNMGVALLDEQLAALSKNRTKVSADRESTTVTLMTDEEIGKMSREELVKAVRNVQSRKCSAKKIGEDDKVEELEALEAKLVAARDKAPATETKIKAMSSKIAETIAELEKLPQSEAIAAQIEMLRKLL